MSNKEFAGKAVIITGGAQGMGRNMAEQFLHEGANVLIFDLDAQLAAETAQQLARQSGEERIVSVGGNVSRREDVHGAVELCLERFGRLDVMVAQAGIADAQPLLEIEDVSWQRIMAVNLTGVFLCTQEAGRAMARLGGGAIVAMASTNAFQVEENLSHYNTSKGGVVAFVRSAALDLARYGIRVNAVAPGVVRTRLAAWITEDTERATNYLQQIPLKRFAETQDVANAVSFLASSNAAYITGQILVIDGGQTLGIMADDAPIAPFPGFEQASTADEG
ncbi:SDR family oxidoreductase [Ktedonosporobacter rubrisoli]|uniref:SDR family oxidoreductase n=1 Tax=Ktedonosporobacter rubrisoli TaxID=2509675 RepID=A0A4P6JHY7_KTERU|nr:SDR family oxidoreductase [Ktedonosporobacter rubrisoli]QBD74659.1 SDR family oxidoreductase [Ktedonosporobacter rubrisoli]